jgi:pimeloyl-ACP methyl ester carboxylesterase
MSDFVLVHGAWHGSWSWDAVAERLRAAGHGVITPDLAVVAGAASTPGDTLASHIAEALTVIRSHGLTDFVLCGHSYGGMVATGIADAIPERVRGLVYLDAYVPRGGDSVSSLSGGPADRAGWMSVPHFQAVARDAKGWPGWTVRELHGSHDLMIDRADAVCAMLLDAAG